MSVKPPSGSLENSSGSDDDNHVHPSKRRKLSRSSLLKESIATPTSLTATYCDRCSSIDLQKAFDLRGLTKDGKAIVALDDLPDNSDDTSCPLCRLFISVCSRHQRFQKYHLRLFDSIRVLGAKRLSRLKSNNLLAVVPGPLSRKFQKVTNRSLIHRGLISQLPSPALEPDAVVYASRLVSQTKIAYPELKQWLEECLESHKECRQPAQQLLPDMKVIDCSRRCIASMKAGMDYFTLSYVWGTVHRDIQAMSDEDKNKLLLAGQVPRTIADAIEVTRQLGYRYLWVDQFCIGEAGRSVQIQNMDKIYEGSVATMVAAAGNDAESGLAGVSSNRSFDQHQVSLDETCLASTMPHVSFFLQTSKWRTRAWTYQEAMLSRRILFFTDAQVYFVCKSTTYCEAVQQSAAASSSSVKSNSSMTLGPSMFRSDSATGVKNTNPDFVNQLREYSHRDLSHESDSLDAFKGLLARAQFQSYFGVPLYFTAPDETQLRLGSTERRFPQMEADLRRRRNDRDVAGFAQGLLWVCAAEYRTVESPSVRLGSVEREESCPSWSWTSLRRHTRYLNHNPKVGQAMLRFDRSQSSQRNIMIEQNDGQLCMFQDVVGADNTEESHIIPEQSRWIHVTGQEIRVVLEEKNHGSANEVPSSHTVSQVDSIYTHYPSKKLGSAWIDTDLMSASGFQPDLRLVQQTWTAVELCRERPDISKFKSSRPLDPDVDEPPVSASRSWWMLLDDLDGSYRRIGLMRSWADVGQNWPTKTFRIG